MSTQLHNNDKSLSSITPTTHLTDLYLSLEQLVYIQIAALYYQDNSFLNLFLRWIATTNFVPATAAALHRVPVTLLLNGICLLSHLLSASPAPSTEHSRGYMDGSVLIDFVGEFAGTSRVKLLMQDGLLVTLHVLMMVVGNIRQKSSQDAKEGGQAGVAAADGAGAAGVLQDIDAEEQGVRRDGAAAAEDNGDVRVLENGDVEMQTLLPGSSSSSSSSPSSSDTLPPIIELNVMHEIRNVIRDNAEMYNRVRAGNEQAFRAVLEAVATGRARTQTPTTTETQPPTV